MRAGAPDGSRVEARWVMNALQPNVARSEFRVSGPGGAGWSARLDGAPAFMCVADGGGAFLLSQREGPVLIPGDLHLFTRDGDHRVIPRDAFAPPASVPSFNSRFFLRDCWWLPARRAWALSTRDDRIYWLAGADKPRPASAEEAAAALSEPARLPAGARSRLARKKLRVE